MSDWNLNNNGNWSDASKWTGGIPDAAGATANFTIAGAGASGRIIGFLQNEDFTVGTLNVVTDSNDTWTFLAGAGVTQATLRFAGAGGAPAFLNVDTNGSPGQSRISNANGMRVMLDSDLIVTTTDSDTLFGLSAPIIGSRDIYKFGDGTLQLFGNNNQMTGDFFLNGGRTEVNASGLSGGGIVKLNNGATLVGVNSSFTLSSNIETGSGNAQGNIVAETGRTLTLTGQIELRSSRSDAVTFGSATDTGTIVLSGTSLINGAGGFFIEGGTLHFGNAGVAANYFSALSTTASIVGVLGGAVLDTGGFSATIDQLVVAGGTLQSTGGALDVTSDHSFASAGLSGTIVGTAQADRLVFNANSLSLSALLFNSWNGSIDTITLNGSNGTDFLFGSTQNDTINGGGGNDTLQGFGGVDTIRGGTGDDTYQIVDTLSTLIENADEGTDTIRVLTGGPTVFTLATHFENLSFDGSAQHEGTGNAADNLITGGSGVDELFGEGGDDTLDGAGGNDVLDGGTGADVMIGAAGDDFYFVDNAGDTVTEVAGFGTDRVFASVSYVLTAGSSVETLNTTNNAGTTAINLTGNALGQTIVGNAGNNVLTGGGGGDVLIGFGGDDTLIGAADAPSTLQGGLGNDTYRIFNASDSILEFAGEGNDRILTSVSLVLGAGREIEELFTTDPASTAALNLTGNAFGQAIIGNAGANTLTGGGGSDYLIGGAGDDVLVGNADANSQLQGGTGDDRYFVSRTGDSIIEFAGEGNDRILASVSYTLTPGKEVEILSTTSSSGTGALNLTGNEFAQTIIGNNGANILAGAGGADNLAGFGGNDILAGGEGGDVLNGGADNDILNGGAGADVFIFADALAANVDLVQDFVSGLDRLFLENAVFTGLSTGALAAGAFRVGNAALDADDRIIYNPANGALLFDADGNGAGAAVQFATLSGAPALAASDFVVI